MHSLNSLNSLLAAAIRADRLRVAEIARRANAAARLRALPAKPLPEDGNFAGIGMGAEGLKRSQILDNVITGMVSEGIVLRLGNTDNVVRGNTVTDNASNGIRVEVGATANIFEANEILGNGRTVNGAGDARDDAREFNVWSGNVCLTDIPTGSICAIGSADASR